ncbi:synapse differentiation-inducing gene protein 1 isoform X2 [Osmerus eperlanus]|uniref:synapse differentiation-inducing gene protein 1 isoform X2 n=1 Tax=Osmerus eperlanus TaxID=29151 RepID=UPI002E106928
MEGTQAEALGSTQAEEAESLTPGKTSPTGEREAGPCKRNGLINTHSLMVETKEGLMSVYSAPNYQGHVVVNLSPQQEQNGSGGGRGPPQLLNPSALPQSMDPRFRPNLILYSENMLRAWGEGGDCCETTFIEDLASGSSSASVPKDALFADGKFLDLSVEEAKIHTLSYDIDDDDEFQELETNKAVSKGDFHLASSSSRRALFLAVLSITIGTGIYVGVAVALIAYLSKNHHL